MALALTLAFLLDQPAQAEGIATGDGGPEPGPQGNGPRPGGAAAPPSRTLKPAAFSTDNPWISPRHSQAPEEGSSGGGGSSLAARGVVGSGSSPGLPGPGLTPAARFDVGGVLIEGGGAFPPAHSIGGAKGAIAQMPAPNHADGGKVDGAPPLAPMAPATAPETPLATPLATAVEDEGEIPPIVSPQSLRIRLERQESVVARSVEGPASVVLDTNQVALEGARLDLSQAWLPLFSVESSRLLDGLALSVLGTGELRQRSSNQAINGSVITGGAEGSNYQIRARDALALALRSGQGGLITVDDRVEGLRDSVLASGGMSASSTVEIGAFLALTLAGAAGSAGSAGLGGTLGLTSTAVNTSSIHLGDGPDTVRIASRVSSEVPPEPFALAPTAAGLDALPLRSRAVGLAHSQLSTGGGDDSVEIAALSTHAGAQQATASASGSSESGFSEALALEDSLVALGGGDDHLLLDGAVSRSRIDPGEGSNRVDVMGAVTESVLQLSRLGSTAITLSAADDSLTLEGEGGMLLQAGGGDDRIVVAGSPIGALDGGDGFDALLVAPELPRAAASLDPPALALQGWNSGLLHGLTFSSVEAISLAGGGNRVAIDPQGSLEGSLRGGPGADTLDYGAWSKGVAVDLAVGSATAIKAGAAAATTGFESILGGQGSDHLVAGANTQAIDGGGGDDWLEFKPLERRESGSALRLNGGAGGDLFVLAGLDSLMLARPGAAWATAAAERSDSLLARPLPSLMDLSLVRGPAGELQLSDRLAWRSSAAAGAEPALGGLIELNPAGLEGLGQSRSLPIAPLQSLLAGIGTGAPQLAIATDLEASHLVLLGPSRFSLDLAILPALHGSASPASTPMSF